MLTVVEHQPVRKSADTVPLFRLSVDQYHAMLREGILWPDAPVELLEGLLVEKRHGIPRPDDPVVDGERLPLFRLRLEDYRRMIEEGILADGADVEFLEGLLISKMVRRPPHDTALGLLQDVQGAHLREGWFLRVQSAITLTDGEPEPDLAIVRGHRRDDTAEHPTARECGLVVEVGDASLALDQGLKLKTYARHSVIEYWIVNLVDQHVEVYDQPSGLVASPGFGRRRIYDAHESIPFRLDGHPVADVPVADILPWEEN